MYIVGNTGNDVNEYDLSTAWDISTAVYLQNFSVATEDVTPTGIFFNPDGSKMYVVGEAGDDINEYDLRSIDSILTNIENWEDSDYADTAKVIPPITPSTDTLSCLATAATDTISAPGAGHALEIYGYVITMVDEDATGLGGYVLLCDEDNNSPLFYEDGGKDTQAYSKSVVVIGIRVRLAVNKALKFQNFTFTGGAFKSRAVVFYKDVTI